MASLSRYDIVRIINSEMTHIESIDSEVKRAIEGLIEGIARAIVENNSNLEYYVRKSEPLKGGPSP
jgi:hypothetical protein